MKYDKNKIWTKKDIAVAYKKENPDWLWSKCWDKAELIYKELNKLNRETFRNTDKFFKMNTPFSFYRSEDGELSSIPELDDVL